MTALLQVLTAEIVANGPIRLDTFIEMALHHPHHGYYAGRDPIGARGDFITAPEISQVFGELIGAWVVAVWEGLGRPDPLQLVELGPGRGTLLRDALRLMGQVAPALPPALRLALVERSPILRAAQTVALAPPLVPSPPQWFDDFDAIPAGPMILIANEFFDALPIRQLVKTEAGWKERWVGVDADGDDRLTYLLAPLADMEEVPYWAADAATGDLIETCAPAEALASAIGTRLAATGGAALIIDYGPSRSSPGDSLQAVAAHRPAAVLDRPGEADLSHHVDFASLSRAAERRGAQVHGPVPQGLLLGRLGAALRAAELMAAAPEGDRDAIATAVRRLVHPSGMGLLFKAVAITPAGQPPPPGFEASRG